MSLQKITLILLFSFATIQSQIISFSEDSLSIYWNNDEFMASDTTWLFNIGDSNLFIDSILTKNYYGYRIYSSSFSPSNSYVVGYDKPPANFNIEPGDSMEIILAEPDLCPICKQSSLQYFTDTLLFVSNSTTGRYTILDVSGEVFTTSISNNEIVPTIVKLNQNYPNPFNPTTNINYSVPKSQNVKIVIYDLLGNEVKTILNEHKIAGNYSINFNAENLSSGIYFYRLIAGENILTKKMTFIK